MSKIQKNNNRSVGRPTKYSPAYCEDVKRLRKAGFSQAALCSFLDIGETTFYNWVAEHPEFKEAVEASVQHSKAALEDLLLKAGRGELPKGASVAAIQTMMARQHGATPTSNDTNKTEINIGNMNVLQQMSDQDLLTTLANKMRGAKIAIPDSIPIAESNGDDVEGTAKGS